MTGTIDVEAFRHLAREAGRFGRSVSSVLDTFRYRMLLTKLTRSHTYDEARAKRLLIEAQKIRNGKRRHRAVRHSRSLLRAARKDIYRQYR